MRRREKERERERKREKERMREKEKQIYKYTDAQIKRNGERQYFYFLGNIDFASIAAAAASMAAS